MANYTVNNLNEAAWLVYINGLELPVSRVEVQWTIWQMPTLTLQMVPHPILTRIGSEDRLQVLVCYLDVHWNPDDPQFCVLGEYEVVGWTYSNTPRGRFIQLNCVSQLQILDQLHFYYMSGVENVPEGMQNANEGVVQPKVFYPASLFYEGLIQPPVEDSTTPANSDAKTQFIRRPIDFVLNVFRALRRPVDMEAQTYAEVKPGHVAKDAAGNPGKNFFSRWMTLTKFHERWAALPLMEDMAVVGDKEGCFPIIQATQETMVLGLLERKIGEGVGPVGTAWDLFRQIFGYMCMEIGVIPAPPYSYTAKLTGELTSNILGEIDDPTTGFYSIPTYFVKPQCIFALPPICNVIFPSMSSHFAFSESYITQPTRIYLGETFLSTQLNQDQNAPLQEITNQLMRTGYPVAVKERIKTLGVAGNLNSKNFLLFPEEFFKGPVTRQLSAPPWMWMLQQNFTARAEEGVDQVKQADSSAREAALNEAKRTNVSRNALLNNDLISEEGKAKELQKIDQKIQQEVEMKFARTGTAQKTAAEVEEVVAAVEAEGAASVLGNIFDVYAQYEYFRSRFAERNGTLNLAWNPYIVPGFPTVIFDDLSAGIDMFGYVTSVSHVMSAERGGSTMATSISLSFLRTVEEYIGIFDKSASERYAQGYSTFPPEVIPDVQNYFQKVSNAKPLYERLFFGGLKVENKSAVFDWRSVVEATSDYVEIDLASPHWNEYSFIQFTPKEEYMPLYRNRDAALGFVARPVCTLQQYIECWHKKRLSALKSSGTIKGEEYSFHSPVADSLKRGGTIFWSRIYTLNPGPGATPDALVMNMTPDYMVPPDGKWNGIGPETKFPETRVDWDKKLEEYRKIIRSTDSNVVPQK